MHINNTCPTLACLNHRYHKESVPLKNSFLPPPPLWVFNARNIRFCSRYSGFMLSFEIFSKYYQGHWPNLL